MTFGPTTTDTGDDPFKPSNLRLSQQFTEIVGVKKLLTTVPVRKPNPQDFVRVHPDPAFRGQFAILELKEEREEYIVTNNAVHELSEEAVNKVLYTAITRQGTPFMWPVRLPTSEGKDMDWWRSAREAAERATNA
jgi:hypothetical protein